MCQTPTTLIEAVKFFSDIDTCNAYMMQVKWPDGNVVCPSCGGGRIGIIHTRKMLRCKDCRKQFSYKVGTIFKDSAIGLDKWFVAVWSVTNCKNGISSHELDGRWASRKKARGTCCTEFGWRCRTNSPEILKGTVEADETFVGGKAKNMHKWKRKEVIQGRGFSGKAIVQGVLQRGGRAIAGVVKVTKRSTIQPHVRAVVEEGSTIYTDALASYEGLSDAYLHDTVDHAKEYVRGDVHTNGMECLWSLLKRGLKGTYISVMPWHLFRYVDGQVFRFNERKLNDGQRFDVVMHRVLGKRLQYAELIG